MMQCIKCFESISMTIDNNQEYICGYCKNYYALNTIILGGNT